MERDIRILLVDDHQVVREGLSHMLAQEEDMIVVGQSANSEETMLQLGKFSPNIVLMDIKMPGVDGIELTRQVKQKYPNCKVIMLTLYDEYLTQALEAGASGYLLKDIKHRELTQAIRQVFKGSVVISESITSKQQNSYLYREKRTDEGDRNLVEEVQVVIPPPVEANQLMRFANRLEDALQSRVLQVIGSWVEGTAMTIVLTDATPIENIMDKLGEIPEIQAAEEKPLTSESDPVLFKKTSSIPRVKNRLSKTIFVTLGKN